MKKYAVPRFMTFEELLECARISKGQSTDCFARTESQSSDLVLTFDSARGKLLT